MDISHIKSLITWRVPSSSGVVYIVIQNLPRELRYKTENIILIGIIPGPREPKLVMNSYLAPLVDELQELWKGVEIEVPHSVYGFDSVTIRAALSCVSCDLPAVRKVCGFYGHMATKGCSKCLHSFTVSGIGSRTDYSGYDRETWELRTKSKHLEVCRQFCSANTLAAQNELGSTHGLRYSVLVELPYFDPIRMHVVDPMHNLLLGTAKHALQTWIDLGLLSPSSFERIEERVHGLSSPRESGRLPAKISASFAGFTADQWRNWTTIFSAVALKGVLPHAHYVCWLLFVKACSMLCTRIIRKDYVATADMFLIQYCKQVQQLYGPEVCTPNMHMHLHLKECLHDYGPVYSFWCFAYERYNGVLGSYQTNNNCIEPQIMKKFLREQEVRTMEFPSEHSMFATMLESHQTISGSVEETILSSERIQLIQHLSTAPINDGLDFQVTGHVTLLPPKCRKVLTGEDVQHLRCIYEQLYPGAVVSHISHFCIFSRKATFCGELFASQKSQSKKCSTVVAFWPGRGKSLLQVDTCAHPNVGRIQYFFRHSMTLKYSSGQLQQKEHVMCSMRWMQFHQFLDWFGSSALVCSTITEVYDSCCFMPVQRIHRRCAHGVMPIDFGSPLGRESVFVAVPLIRDYCM